VLTQRQSAPGGAGSPAVAHPGAGAEFDNGDDGDAAAYDSEHDDDR
jgi:hypothetical protein